MGGGSGGNFGAAVRGWAVSGASGERAGSGAAIGGGGAQDADAVEAWRQVLAVVEREGGPLGAALRRFQSLPLPEGALDETWRWLAYVRISRGLTSSSAARYLEVLGRYFVYCAGKGLDWRTVGAVELDAWQRHLAFARHNAEIWRATQLMALRNFYSWRAQYRGAKNATDGVQAPRFVRRKRRKYTTREVQAMLAACAGGDALSRRDRTLLMFLLTTGARREECAHLRLDQLDIGERRGSVRFLGKGRKERIVTIDGPIVSLLREWLLMRDQLPHTDRHRVWISLSSSGKGRPLTVNGIEHVVARAAKRAGLTSWGVHRFRVTFATMLYDDGADPENIARLLGHNDINTTSAYLDVSDRAHTVRLRADRQADLLGTRPLMPRWMARKLDNPTKRGNDAPT